ncbi:hypothetical protein [Akkermansia muciniphila]|uniref:PBECR3 domain-containing polyvalent protein n=1 Tax=Akkermansia muciniphila TaxID=239935 RepID=UPI000C9AE289|nr:hypothetical protein [Akkermansia muciniphila]PNC81663.1 hypothetical protein CXT92_08620 [Akkermansia muciniphila]PND12745.1 hypothetical protein CXT96_10395 [Akkermansia muciniphila]
MNIALNVNGQKELNRMNVPDESGHVDLRPPIVNRPQAGPEMQLNVLDDEQAGNVAVAVEDEGRSWEPGQVITNDRQYRSVMADFNLMSVDSPDYDRVRQSLDEYWDRRGLGNGHVAEAADVRRGRAYQLMAELGDGSELDQEQVNEVERTLGKGVVDFYKGLSQEEKDEVLVDGFVQSFVGGAPALSRVYLAERLGLDTDEASVMAAELRRQAGVGRIRREQVKKDMGEVWGEMVTATGSGKEFSLDPRDHQGRSPEFLAGAASLADSQRMAAAFIKDMVYGEDGRSPRAQGMQTGIDGLRTYGFSKYEEGRWVVELANLHRKDEQAYELAVSAIAGLVDYQKENESAFSRMLNNFSGMAVEGLVHGPSRWLESGVMDFLQSAGLVQRGEEKFDDPLWIQRVNKVAQDIQQVRMGQYRARSSHGMVNFLEEASGVFGGAVPFIMTGGVGSLLEAEDTAETGYLAKGVDGLTARNAAYGEGMGMWAANIWGLGKGGKLVGKAYDKLMNWAGRKTGMKGLLGRALETDRFWGRGPLFVGLEGGVLHAQTVIEPYARSVASNMFSWGNGKSWDEADAEAREAMTWRNFLVALPMSLLLGYGRYAKNSPFRAAAIADERIWGIKAECAECPEAMKGLHFTDEEIKMILNTENDRDKIRLFDLTLHRKIEGKVAETVGEPIGVLMTPDVPLVKSLMEERILPRAEVVNGKLRVYDVETTLGAVTWDKDENSVQGSEGREGAARKRENGKEFVEMDLETGNRFLTTKVRDWAVNQDFTLRNAALNDASVDYFAERCGVDFRKEGTTISYRALKRMADDALMRIAERSRKKVWSNDDQNAHEEDVLLAVLPNNFRDRVEIALKRGELARGDGFSGEVTEEEIAAVAEREGVHTPAFNYELEMGKKVIRYYEGEATFLDLVEEMAELYVKGEMKAGRELTWFSRNLLDTQKAFKDQGVNNWKLVDESFFADGADAGKREKAVIEGMSKLMQAVFMGEYRKKALPAPVKRFLEVMEALIRKVADMVGLAGAFRKAVDSGTVKGDFASFVYDAVGADFAQSRSELTKKKFENQLKELREKPERLLQDYGFHLMYAERYGLENYRQQVMDDLLANDKEQREREFAQAGIDFFQLMKGATLEEAKMVLSFVKEGRRETVSFSISEKLDEMGKDAGKRKVMDFVDMVVSSNVPDKTSLGVMEYRGASAREIADIKAGLGIDVTGMVHEFSADAIIHALNKHGHDAKKGKDQLDLTKDDVKLVLDVLDEYDRMEFRPKGKNLSSVIYVKQYPHGEIHAVEQVIETTKRRYSKKPRLTFKTAWVESTPTGSKPGTMGVYTPRRTENSMANEGENVNSVAEAQEQGLFHDGHFETGNAVITEPGVTFSITALHASPHSFRKFSTDYMGQGEGAQAYGWGLYFAENPEVNRAYMDRFSQNKETLIREIEAYSERKFYSVHSDLIYTLRQLSVLYPDKVLADGLRQYINTESVRVKKRREEAGDDVPNYMAHILKREEEKLKDLQQILNWIHSGGELSAEMLSASNYRVELNVDDSVLLDWDRPVPENLRALMQSSPVEAVRELAGALSTNRDGTKYWTYQDYTGEAIYKKLMDDLFMDRPRSEVPDKNGRQKAASLALLDSGIKGIRYADGLSRREEGDEQTYNYVIFDGHDIKITAFADESTGGEWADYVDGSATFSVREDLLGDMKRQMEKTRSDAVREYWRHVTERVEKEGRALDALFRGREAGTNDVRVKIAEARSIMKVAVSTLPEKVRGKLAGQEKLLDYLMSALETGRFSATDALTEKQLAAANRKMELHPEFFDDLVGKTVESLLPKVYQRCGEVIDLYVRDELFREVRSMISEHEAVIDEKTRKFKVSRLGADPTEFLRRVIKPAVYATGRDVQERVNELSGRIAAIEEKLRTDKFWNGELGTDGSEAEGGLLMEKQRLCGELNWWIKYSAAGSADVNRMLDIHEAVGSFISRSAEVWQVHLQEKVDGWKNDGAALMEELPKAVNQNGLHQAQMEVSDLGVDSETGRAKRGVMLGWLDNPVRFLQRLCDGPGKQFFSRFKKEFIGATDRAQSIRAEEVDKMNGVLKRLLNTKSDRKVNEFLSMWSTPEDLGLSLSERGVKKTKLTIDQTAKLLERREKNPWWGVDMYSQKAIDLLREEYEAWGRGENRARKWFEVEEWYDMEPQPMPKLSRDQALFVLMCMDQPNVFYSKMDDFVPPLRRRGWTDEHKAKLEEFIGPVGMALKSVLFEEYALVGDKIRPLYEDRYGVPFSKRRNYSPLRWMVAETQEDSELASILGDDGTIAVGRSDGFLSTRIFDHKRYLDTTQGALALFWKHHANAVNWVCTQEIVERYQGILSDSKVAQMLMTNIGGLDYRGFQALINRLEHGGRDAVAELDAAERMKNEIMNARALSVILGQVTSYLKQTTAVFNALHGCDLSISDWVHGLARVVSGKSVLSVQELFSSDLFQARKDGFMYSVLLGYKKQLGGRVGLLDEVTNQSGKIFGLLDSGSNAVSFAAAFDHYFRQGVEQGMTKPEAMEYARDVIEEGLSTAQPINWIQMPKMLEKTKGIFSAEWFLMSETLQRSATVIHYLTRGNMRLAVRSWLIQGVAMQALGYLINNVMRPGGDDDEKKNPLNYLPGIVLGPLNGVPLLGNLTDSAVDTVCGWLGLKMQNQTAVMGSQVDLTVKDLMRLIHIFEADSWRDVRQQSRSVATLGSLAAMFGAWRNPRGGAITSVSLGMAVMANYFKHLAGMAEKWFGE